MSRIYSTLASTLRGLNHVESDRVLARGASISLAMRIGSVAFAYLANLLLARWMGVTAYGQYVYALGLAVPLAVIVGLGIDQAGLRHLPVYAAAPELGKIRGFLGWSRRTVAGASLFAASVVAIGVALAGNLVPTDLRMPILFGCALAPLLAFTRLNSSILLGFKRTGLASLHDLIRPILLIVFAGTLAWMMGLLSVAATVTALAASMMLVIGLQTVLIRRSSPPGVFESAPKTDSSVWINTIRAMFFIQVLHIVMSKLDIMLIGAMIDVNSVAIYGVARRIAVLIGFSEVAVVMIAQPVIAEFHAQGKIKDLRRVVSVAAHISLWPTLLAAMVAAFFSENILGMFGTEFVAGSSALRVLLGAQVLHAMVSPAFVLLSFAGYHNAAARITALVFVINVVLLTAGINWMGMMGAAWASVAVALVWNLTLHTWVWVKLGIPSIPFARNR